MIPKNTPWMLGSSLSYVRYHDTVSSQKPNLEVLHYYNLEFQLEEKPLFESSILFLLRFLNWFEAGWEVGNAQSEHVLHLDMVCQDMWELDDMSGIERQ